MATALDLVTMALRDLGVINAVDPPSAEDAAFALSKLNVLLDNWNAERQAVYEDVFASYTLTPSLAPHTIGPSGTFNVAQRPVSLEGCNLILTSTTPVTRTPITIRDGNWWLNVATRDLTSEYPTDVYYDAGWPLGSLYFWPVPTVAYQVEVWTRGLLSSVSLQTAFSMPPGYQDALTLTLEEMLIPAFRVAGPPGLSSAAAKCRARIQANNVVVPNIVTRQAGMPGGCGGTRLDWRTREIV